MPSRYDPHKLTPGQNDQRNRAAHAKADMVRLRISLAEAARRNHLRPAAVRRWFPDSIVHGRPGHLIVSDDDEVFVLTVVTTDGVMELDVQGSAQREIVSHHWNAIGRLLDPRTGDPAPLIALRGVRVAGHELQCDPDAIEELWLGGELDFVQVYVEDV